MMEGTGIHAEKTMFPTRLALIVIQMPCGTVDQMAVGSAVIMAGVSFLNITSAGTGETVEKLKEKELNASGSFKVLSEDDHRKIY